MTTWREKERWMYGQAATDGQTDRDRDRQRQRQTETDQRAVSVRTSVEGGWCRHGATVFAKPPLLAQPEVISGVQWAYAIAQ